MLNQSLSLKEMESQVLITDLIALDCHLCPLSESYRRAESTSAVFAPTDPVLA